MEITMTKANDIISMVESLPIEMKTQLIDKLLNSLHPSQKEIDELWAIEAERRVEEISTGKVETIPGEDVIREMREKLSK